MWWAILGLFHQIVFTQRKIIRTFLCYTTTVHNHNPITSCNISEVGVLHHYYISCPPLHFAIWTVGQPIWAYQKSGEAMAPSRPIKRHCCSVELSINHFTFVLTVNNTFCQINKIHTGEVCGCGSLGVKLQAPEQFCEMWTKCASFFFFFFFSERFGSLEKILPSKLR